MGVHDVDAMQWIARSRITRVYAQKLEVLGTGNEDALYAVVNFENGAIGNIDYSWAWPDGLMNGFRAALEIVGTRSAAYLDCTDQGFYAVDDEWDERAATRISGRRSTAASSATWPTRSPISSRRRLTGTALSCSTIAKRSTPSPCSTRWPNPRAPDCRSKCCAD